MKYNMKLLFFICGCFTIISALPVKRDLYAVKQYLNSLVRNEDDLLNSTGQPFTNGAYTQLTAQQTGAVKSAGPVKGCDCGKYDYKKIIKQYLRTYEQKKRFVVRLVGGLGAFYVYRALRSK